MPGDFTERINQREIVRSPRTLSYHTRQQDRLETRRYSRETLK